MKLSFYRLWIRFFWIFRSPHRRIGTYLLNGYTLNANFESNELVIEKNKIN
jgi:hypothetical protein